MSPVPSWPSRVLALHAQFPHPMAPRPPPFDLCSFRLRRGSGPPSWREAKRLRLLSGGQQVQSRRYFPFPDLSPSPSGARARLRPTTALTMVRSEPGRSPGSGLACPLSLRVVLVLGPEESLLEGLEHGASARR